MASKNEQSGHITTAPAHVNIVSRKLSSDDDTLLDETKKKKSYAAKAFAHFLYDPKRRTVLGRDALNWGKEKFTVPIISLFSILAKLSAFYTAFYFFLGCFFVALVYVFAAILDRTTPRYHNTQSTMAVRSPYAVGLYQINFILYSI
jgi:hypothetical protein